MTTTGRHSPQKDRRAWGDARVALAGLAAAVLIAWAGVSHAGAEAPAPQQHKLSLTIRCLSDGLKVGDVIPIEFHVKNGGDEVYTYMDRNYDRSGRMDEYRLDAVDAKGQAVADPRAKRRAGIGGGLATDGKLAGGEYFTKTIALNRWALVKHPGKYTVTGTYRARSHGPGKIAEIRARPITITIAGRTAKEMGQYIEGLGERLGAAKDSAERQRIIQKLMYTCDARIIPILVDSLQARHTYWQLEAFRYYLPQDDKTRGRLRDEILAKASTLGLPSGTVSLLKELGCGPKVIRPLIEVSLRPGNSHAWAEGALAAQRHPDNSYTARLMEIASSTKSNGWTGAIYALAFNRTDESVGFLRKLLNGPDKNLRRVAASAVRAAYVYRGNAPGRPLKKGDFPAEYQRPKP